MSLPADPAVYTDFTGLAALRREARESGGRDPETLRTVAGQFEALFVQMMLKSMREAKLDEGLFDSQETEFYQGMFDQQIALELSRGRGLGLADMLVRQLGGEVPRPGRPESSQATAPSSRAQTTAADFSPRSPRPAPAEPAGQWPPESPAAFVRELWPHAERAARRIGADPALLLAQAALESGWGRRVMTRPDGQPAYNLFGIKADGRWNGEAVGAATLEFRGGAMQRERARFRAYGSPGESFADYVAFLQGSPRYAGALAVANDPERFAQGLARAGYATDPDYASKIMAVYRSPAFREAVAEAQRIRFAAASSP